MMNCDGKMSFGDYIFPINPYLIKLTHKKQIAEQHIPMNGSVVSDMGRLTVRISGEGEFCGENCREDFEALKRLYECSSAEMLYIPSQKPVYAVFERLELIGSDVEGVIRYSFSFVGSSEAPAGKRRSATGDGKKCLWDISYESGIDIDSLADMNPDIKRPDIPIPAGRRIILC